MTIAFDLDRVVTTEFGVGRDEAGIPEFCAVPVDADVQAALRSMAQATVEQMEADEDGGAVYQPSEKHGATEYLVVPAGASLEATLRALHDAENLPLDVAALAAPQRIVSYFARFTDGVDRRLTATRRATQFKGVLKSRLIRVFDDSLKIVEDDIFKLDNDFDLLVDSDSTHIWRPSAFEFMGALKQAILDAVPTNVEAIQAELPFVDFSGIEAYAKVRPRAARYLASIRSQVLQGVDRQALIELCCNTDVGVAEVDGKLSVDDGSEMGFLEVLDRRRYRLELVPDQPERFRASRRERMAAG